MPSPSGSTPIFGLPYLLETDVPDVATASQLLAQAIEDLLENVAVPIGGSIDWWSNTLPTYGAWTFLHGQTITGGVALYPALAALYPAWVSGANLVLPDTRNRVTIGAGSTYAVGVTGGSATSTLQTVNIPHFTNATLTTADQVDLAFDLLPSLGGGLAKAGSSLATGVAYRNDGAPAGYLAASGSVGVTFSLLDEKEYSIIVPGYNQVTTFNVSFGQTSPTSFTNLPPYVACQKIVRLA